MRTLNEFDEDFESKDDIEEEEDFDQPTKDNLRFFQDEAQYEINITNIQNQNEQKDTFSTKSANKSTPHSSQRKVSSKHVRSMSARMRKRAFLSLIILTAATIFDFVVRIANHGFNLSLITEYTELIILCILVIFGVYSLILRFKTNLLFFIFASIAFGLLTAMMQAIIQAKNLENHYENQKHQPLPPNGGKPELPEQYLILHSIGNICLSISCFISAVCFYFYRDALIMFDFTKGSKINNVRSPSLYGQFKLIG